MIVGEVLEFDEPTISDSDVSDADTSRSSLDENISDTEEDVEYSDTETEVEYSDTETESSDEESEDVKHVNFKADLDDSEKKCPLFGEHQKNSAVDITDVLLIFIWRSTFLPGEYRDNLLALANVADLNVAFRNLRCLLGSLLLEVQRAIRSDNWIYVDDIICFIRNVYVDLIDDPVTSEEIAEPDYAEICFGFLKLRKLRLYNKSDILQILAVMACNSRVIAHLLMKECSVEMLTRSSCKFSVHEESSKMDLSSLIWAVLPVETYLDSETRKMNYVMRNKMYKSIVTNYLLKMVPASSAVRYTDVPCYSTIKDHFKI